MPKATAGRTRPEARKYHQLADADWLRHQYVDLGRSTDDLAAEVGCVRETVRYYLRRHGIAQRQSFFGKTSNGSKYPQLHDPAWLREQYQARGRSSQDIAAELGCSPASVAYHLREFSIPRHTRWPGGERRQMVCKRCSKRFTPSGPAQRFCSQDCRAGTRACERCKKEFRVPLPKGTRKRVSQKRFCSRTCEYAWRKEVIVREPTNHRRLKNEGYVEINIGPPRFRVLEHILVMERTLGRELLPGENVHHKNGVKHDNRPTNLELWVVHQPSGQRAKDLLAWAEEIVARYAPERDKL